MWNKSSEAKPTSSPNKEVSVAAPKSAPMAPSSFVPAAAPTPASPAVDTSRVGPGLRFKGELSGTSDLYIDGEMNGNVRLEDSLVVVGPNGRVKADIQAREIMVHGTLNGNLFAAERIHELGRESRVGGNLSSKHIQIEDGALFKGLVDMDIRKAAARPAERWRSNAPRPMGQWQFGHHHPVRFSRTDGAVGRPGARFRFRCAAEFGCSGDAPCHPVNRRQGGELKMGWMAKVRTADPPGSPSMSARSKDFDSQTAASPRVSNGLKEFLWLASDTNRGTILDLGPAWQATLTFFAEKGYRITSDDLLRTWWAFLTGEEERLRSLGINAERPTKDALAEQFLEDSLQYSEGSYNGILMWDLLDYFEPALATRDDGPYLRHAAARRGDAGAVSQPSGGAVPSLSRFGWADDRDGSGGIVRDAGAGSAEP